MVNLFRYCCILLLALQLSPVKAMSSIDEAEKTSWRPELNEQRQPIESAKQVVTDLKAKEPFINMQEEKIWSFEEKKDDKDKSTNAFDGFGWVNDAVKFLAVIVEALLWLVPLLLIYYLYRYREYWMNLVQGRGFRADKTQLADTLFGLDVTPESLPDDIQQEARALWQQGLHREAISLLYRGALAALLRLYTLNLPPGATEHDCLRQVERFQRDATMRTEENLRDRAAHFRQLTSIWINVAYAHRVPVESEFLRLCLSWNENYADAMELN